MNIDTFTLGITEDESTDEMIRSSMDRVQRFSEARHGISHAGLDAPLPSLLHYGPGGSVWRAEDRRLARKMRLPVAELRAREDYPAILYESWDKRGPAPESKVTTRLNDWVTALEPPFIS